MRTKYAFQSMGSRRGQWRPIPVRNGLNPASLAHIFAITGSFAVIQKRSVRRLVLRSPAP
jgi:hypothetical protein